MFSHLQGEVKTTQFVSGVSNMSAYGAFAASFYELYIHDILDYRCITLCSIRKSLIKNTEILCKKYGNSYKIELELEITPLDSRSHVCPFFYLKNRCQKVLGQCSIEMRKTTNIWLIAPNAWRAVDVVLRLREAGLSSIQRSAGGLKGGAIWGFSSHCYILFSAASMITYTFISAKHSTKERFQTPTSGVID